MPTKQENDSLYMGIAIQYSKLSKAKRKQVGACLVTEHGVVLGGYNGCPTGCSNECESTVYTHHDLGCRESLVTKPEVVHAELNCVLKAAREGVSCFNATIYTTLSPCVPCAAMLVNAGIKKLVYSELYRDDSGVQLLKSANVEVEQLI
jgi:dCMP deaminase